MAAEEATVATTAQSPRAKQLIRRVDRLKTKRAGFYDPAWKSAAEWVMPRKSSIWETNEKTPADSGWVDNLFDLTAHTATERLAAWLMTNTSPTNARWFAFAPTNRQRRRLGPLALQRAQRWYQEITAITLEALHASNFYTEKHEALLDRNTFGTCACGVFEGRSRPLNFRNVEVATYVFEVDEEGQVSAFFREFKLTAAAAARQFGRESLGPQTAAAYAQESGGDKEFKFIHAVYRNDGYEPGRVGATNKAYTSCYVCREDEAIVQEGGFDEMPYAVSRFLKWVGEQWGWAPAFTALPTIRETNFYKLQLNALAEKAAFPPILEPSNLAGQVDSRAGGRTVFDENFPQALPREWQTGGRFDIGEKLLSEDREFINSCFYGEVISLFSNLEREITAYEASQLAAEKLDIFAPYYFRLITELDTPLLQRVFGLLLASGEYPDPPEELFEPASSDDRVTIPFPEVAYLSRLSLALQAHETASFDQLLARAATLATIDPAAAASFIGNYDLDAAARGLGRNLGVPVAWQKDPEQLQAEREAAAQQQQALAAAKLAPGVARAAQMTDQMSPQMKNGMAALASGATS